MRSILIVEDNIRALDALAYLLERDGYAVLRALNGREALNLLAEVPAPSLILLDLAMPVMDGWEFRRQQRLDPALAGIPVIVTAALVSGVPTGVKAVMPKPIDMNKLRELIAKHISPPMETAVAQPERSDLPAGDLSEASTRSTPISGNRRAF